MFFWQVFLLLAAGCELTGLWDQAVPVVHSTGNAAFLLLLVVGWSWRRCCGGVVAHART